MAWLSLVTLNFSNRPWHHSYVSAVAGKESARTNRLVNPNYSYLTQSGLRIEGYNPINRKTTECYQIFRGKFIPQNPSIKLVIFNSLIIDFTRLLIEPAPPPYPVRRETRQRSGFYGVRGITSDSWGYSKICKKVQTFL